MKERAHPTNSILVLIALTVLTGLSVYLWLFQPTSFEATPETTEGEAARENLGSPDSVVEDFGTVGIPRSEGVVSAGELDTDEIGLNTQYTLALNVLEEIGFRISVEQIAEAENELLALE